MFVFDKINILNKLMTAVKKFLVLGADSHLAYHLVRKLNIKYSARNVIACDIKDHTHRSLGCDFIPNVDVRNKDQVIQVIKSIVDRLLKLLETLILLMSFSLLLIDQTHLMIKS